MIIKSIVMTMTMTMMIRYQLVRFPNPHYVVTFKSVGESDSLWPAFKFNPFSNSFPRNLTAELPVSHRL